MIDEQTILGDLNVHFEATVAPAIASFDYQSASGVDIVTKAAGATSDLFSSVG
ncbi:MAG: hypothetical protein ABSD85_17910 [Acidimicrobiales bacterium]